MPLSAGDKLGHLEILSLLGKGGMGEVYRARDTKLKREVALKVLPDSFARDPDRMARFQREAEVLASLNHPNIAQIYGVEDRALVMELVEGESPKGPMPFEEAWKIASQIAAALEYAHDKGIIHRDLKPANLKVTPEGVVKLLDFGLAKAFRAEPAAPADAENSPTLTLGATQVGVILGTAAYVAPEQAKGKTVDKRADIWSFGVVLYELLTGERLFKGEDVSETLAQVLTKQPDLDKAPVPARKLLRRCLEKDPKKRLRDIGEAQHLLEEPLAPIVKRSSLLWPAVAAIATLAALGLGFIAYRHSTEEPPRAIKFRVSPPGKASIDNAVPAVSPDGRHLALQARLGGKSELWIQDLESLTARFLPGTEGGYFPFWSPDSKTVAFFADGKLKRIDIAGGLPVTVCSPCDAVGGSWTRTGKDVILLGGYTSGILRVPAAGGEPALVIKPGKGDRDGRPWFLPDGRHFLYSVAAGQVHQSIYVGDLESGSSKHLLDAGSNAIFVNDRLVYLREGALEGTLLAQPFDPRKLQTTGEAVTIAEGVGVNPVEGAGYFTASDAGVLAYVSGLYGRPFQLTWFDRSGRQLGTVGSLSAIEGWVRLSPDDSTAAASIIEGTNADIWLFDLARGAASRFTFGPKINSAPVWSPDGKQITFYSTREGLMHVFQRALDRGTDQVMNQALGNPPVPTLPEDWSPDGHYVVERRVGPEEDNIWVQPLFGDRKAFPFAPRAERSSRISPDGKWLAYSSYESGHAEVYVQSFPVAGGKVRVSINGGERPAWSRDGKELFFIGADAKLMAAAVRAGAKFEAGEPKALFDTGSDMTLSFNNSFDVSKDGRFLIPVRPREVGSSPLTVMVNWTAGLPK